MRLKKRVEILERQNKDLCNFFKNYFENNDKPLDFKYLFSPNNPYENVWLFINSVDERLKQLEKQKQPPKQPRKPPSSVVGRGGHRKRLKGRKFKPQSEKE